MIFELRTYDLKPGKALVYLDFFGSYGVGLVTRHLPLMGYWMVESGRINRIEHLWAYADLAERDAARAGLGAERDWMEGFVPRAFADVLAQETRLLALEASSPVFDAAVPNRRAHHPNQPEGTAMFAPGLQALGFGEGPGGGTPLACFRVLSGAHPGQRITLAAGDFAALTTGNDGLTAHELLRPLSLSPLR